MKYPYIKPTRFKHDSGFRCFEIGYCEIGEKGEAINIEVLGKCSDHIWLADILNPKKDLSLDLTTNGYIRIYGLDTKGYKWDSIFACSTARIVKKEKL